MRIIKSQLQQHNNNLHEKNVELFKYDLFKNKVTVHKVNKEAKILCVHFTNMLQSTPRTYWTIPVTKSIKP